MAPKAIVTQTGNKEVFATSPSGASPASELRGLGAVSGAAFEGLAKAGEELSVLGEQLAKPEMEARGADAVVRDPATGELSVELRTPLNSMDEAYNHAAKAMMLSQSAGDTRLELQKLAQDNLDDPEKFRTLADAHVKAKAGQSGVPTELRGEILANGIQDVVQFTSSLASQKQVRDTHKALATIKADTDRTKNDIYALAHQNGVDTPEFQALIGKFQNQLSLKRNPLFAISEAEIADELSEVISSAHGEAAVGHALAFAMKHGADAGKEFAEKAVWDTSLNLSPAQRESFANRAKREIGEWESGQREARMEYRQILAGRMDDAQAAAEFTGKWQNVISPSDIERAYPDNPEMVADIISNLNSRAHTYSMRKQVASATPADLADMAVRLNPTRSNFVAGKAEGMTEAGNLDLTARPRVKNADGTTSTVRTITITDDKGAIVIPTVIGDKVVSNEAAIAHYKKTGEHLGKFKSQKQADDYAEALHEQQAGTLGTITEADARGLIQTAFPGATVTSGKRTPEENARVKGVPNSQHLAANAIDFVLPKGKTFEEVKTTLAAKGVPVSELIDEGDHIHWAWGAKGGEGFADRVREYTAFQQAVQERQQVLAKDPAGYITSVRPEIATMFQSDDPGMFQKGVQASMQAQRDMGVLAPKVLGQAQTGAIVQQFNNPQDPAKRADHMVSLIAGLEQRYGKYFPAAMSELQKAGLPSEAIALAQVKNDPAVAARFANAVNATRPVLRKVTPGADDIDKSVVAGLATFNKTLAGQSGNSRVAAQQAEAIQLYAYQLAQEGDANPGKRAVQDIIGKHFTFTNTFRVPTGIDPDAVQAGARQMLREIPNTSIMPEQSLADSRIAPEDRQRISAQVLRGRGVWLTMPDDSGLYLAYPQETGFVPARTAGGQPMRFTWTQLAQAATRRAPTPVTK